MPKRTDNTQKAVKAPARMSKKDPLTREQLHAIDAWWRAANYLSACQLYLLDNPLLREPLKPAHLKQNIVGHWGTCPGQNFIYTHLNRAIVKYELNMIYICGPGHGGNAVVAQDYLDGSYSEVYPNISQDTEGMKRLFRQFSFPGGIPCHTAPETPGSINEGGELGYSLSHAFGAVMDNPDLIASSIPSLWVMLSSYLFAVPGFIYFFSVSGTGNTRRALEIDMASIFVYVLYILYVAVWLRADVAVCWTTEYVYNIMILSSFFYLWKGNWRNKKI